MQELILAITCFGNSAQKYKTRKLKRETTGCEEKRERHHLNMNANQGEGFTLFVIVNI